jgi:hypothetical protein
MNGTYLSQNHRKIATESTESTESTKIFSGYSVFFSVCVRGRFYGGKADPWSVSVIRPHRL